MTETYELILERLEKALQRCDELGLGEMAKRSRFDKYRESLKALIKIVRAPQDIRSLPETNQELSKHKIEYMASLIESIEFADVIQNLQDDNEIFVSKLKHVLRGPFLPNDENAVSNRSRNTLFELKLAVLLKQAGFKPKLGDHPDVKCLVDDTNLFFEYKRPASEKKALKRIKEAGLQLGENIERYGTSKTPGLIVISFAKFFDPDHQAIPIVNQSTARQLMSSWLTNVQRGTRSAWGRFEQSQSIAAIMFHISGVFTSSASAGLEFGEWWLGVKFHGSHDRIVTRMAEALKALEY
jgi:hypothetical protein